MSASSGSPTASSAAIIAARVGDLLLGERRAEGIVRCSQLGARSTQPRLFARPRPVWRASKSRLDPLEAYEAACAAGARPWCPQSPCARAPRGRAAHHVRTHRCDEAARRLRSGRPNIRRSNQRAVCAPRTTSRVSCLFARWSAASAASQPVVIVEDGALDERWVDGHVPQGRTEVLERAQPVGLQAAREERVREAPEVLVRLEDHREDAHGVNGGEIGIGEHFV